MTPGVNRDSHGIKVAKLAGLPAPAISVAEQALAHIKELRGRQQTFSRSSFNDIGALVVANA